MQISQQRAHLHLGEAAGEAGHHSPAPYNILTHRRVSCQGAAWERLPSEDVVQVRRNFLEGQIVVLMAMGATDLVEALPCCLLRSERWR